MRVDSTIALVNLIVQVGLILGALAGAFLGKKRRFRGHCLTMRGLVGVQILVTALVMAPSLGRYLANWGGLSWFMSELIIHHVLGLAVLGLWIFINLAVLGLARTPRHLRHLMWATLGIWLLSLATGIHLYTYIWT